RRPPCLVPRSPARWSAGPLPPSCRDLRFARSGLLAAFGLVPARLPGLLDELDVHRRLGEWLDLRRDRPVLRLLLGFAVGSISRAHRGFLRAVRTLALVASLRITRDFSGAVAFLDSTCPQPELGERF